MKNYVIMGMIMTPIIIETTTIYYRSLPQEHPNEESETAMKMIDDKPTTIETSNVAEELLVFVVSFK